MPTPEEVAAARERAASRAGAKVGSGGAGGGGGGGGRPGPGRVGAAAFQEIDIDAPPITTLVKRVIMSLSGLNKTGKTDWVLRTAKEPVYYICLDPVGKVVADKIAKRWKRRIHIAEFRVQRGLGQEVYGKIWDEVRAAYDAALAVNEGTVVVDTGTELSELLRLAELGKLEQVQARYYGPVNAELKDMLKEAYGSDMSVVFIHKLRKEYVKDNWTGGYSPAGWNDMPYQVQANVETFRDGADGFGIFVIDCMLNMEMTGKEYKVGEGMTFETFVEMATGAAG